MILSIMARDCRGANPDCCDRASKALAAWGAAGSSTVVKYHQGYAEGQGLEVTQFIQENSGDLGAVQQGAIGVGVGLLGAAAGIDDTTHGEAGGKDRTIVR